MKMKQANNKILAYKGYYGSVEFDLESKMLYGQLLGIKGAYIYEGITLEELEADFREFVDDYILSFEEKGQRAPKPNMGTFNVRLGIYLHYNAVEKANKRGISLNSFVKQAVEHELER